MRARNTIRRSHIARILAIEAAAHSASFSCGFLLSMVVYWFPILLVHHVFNLVESYRRKPPAVNPNIKVKCMWIILKAAVGVSVKLPATIMALVPNPHGIVHHVDALALNLHRFDIRDRLKAFPILRPESVMVTQDQMDGPVKPSPVVGDLSPSEITKVVNGILRSDRRVPIVDQGVVMDFHNITDVAESQLSYECVREMGVCCKVNHIEYPSLLGFDILPSIGSDSVTANLFPFSFILGDIYFSEHSFEQKSSVFLYCLTGIPHSKHGRS